MKETKFEFNDVEREGGNEAHFTNDTVRSLIWNIEKVNVGRQLFAEWKPQPLIANINGAALAGMALLRNVHGIYLISCR